MTPKRLQKRLAKNNRVGPSRFERPRLRAGPFSFAALVGMAESNPHLSATKISRLIAEGLPVELETA
jgi:hypothetical protein